MYKRILIVFMSVVLSFILNDLAYSESCVVSGIADFCGNAGDSVGGKYVVTLKKIEISKDGVNFITLGESSGTQINVAGLNVDTQFQAFVSNAQIPAGTYNYIRITLSRTFTIKGRAYEGGQYYYTTTQLGKISTPPYFYKAGRCSGWNPSTNEPSGAPGETCPAYEEVSFKMPDDAEGYHPDTGETIEFVNGGQDARITQKLPSPIVVTEGKSIVLKVKFYTQGMIGFDQAGSDYIFFPTPPAQECEHE